MGTALSEQVSTIAWLQAVSNQPGRVWRSGRHISPDEPGDRMDAVADLSAVTSATEPVALPGDVIAYVHGHGFGPEREVSIVLEVPRKILDEYGRRTAVTVSARARRGYVWPSQVAGALIQELERLKEEGVDLTVPASGFEFELLLRDLFETQSGNPITRRLAARRVHNAAEQQGTPA